MTRLLFPFDASLGSLSLLQLLERCFRFLDLYSTFGGGVGERDLALEDLVESAELLLTLRLLFASLDSLRSGRDDLLPLLADSSPLRLFDLDFSDIVGRSTWHG